LEKYELTVSDLLHSKKKFAKLEKLSKFIANHISEQKEDLKLLYEHIVPYTNKIDEIEAKIDIKFDVQTFKEKHYKKIQAVAKEQGLKQLKIKHD